MMRQLLYSELIKFKFELLSLIQWLKKINLFTINIQTYLSINLLVFIGIGINIYILSTLPEIVYTQEIYDIIYYVGTAIYVLLVAFTNYASLNYYKKVQFNWVNIIITVLLLLILLGGKHFDLSYRKAIFESNNIILWGVDVPDLFYPCLLGSMLLFSVVPRKLWLRDNNVELKGIIFDNKVIDVLWGERNDLTTSQIKAINSFYSRQDKRSLLTDLYKSILINSLWPNGRSTVRQWNLFNVYLAFIIYNMILNYNIENCALRYALYVYLIYTIIIMIFRRLRDSNSSIFWIIGLFVPIINIYVLYLLYNKTSALYDKESNSIFYYAL
ncbi:DUF805 domain-containing protein [Veillonella parvula]|uniref:DUF805 domain-containing protein n=1 Tax=Veillonella parvula TaxID=29466 RepID=UPI003994A427